MDERPVTRLLLRTYHQHRNGFLAARCLDLLDQMSLSSTAYVDEALKRYDR